MNHPPLHTWVTVNIYDVLYFGCDVVAFTRKAAAHASIEINGPDFAVVGKVIDRIAIQRSAPVVVPLMN